MPDKKIVGVERFSITDTVVCDLGTHGSRTFGEELIHVNKMCTIIDRLHRHPPLQRCQPSLPQTCSQPFGSLRMACPPMQTIPVRLPSDEPRGGKSTMLDDGPGRPALRALD